MGDDATVKFGYDGRALDAGMNAQERRMLNAAGRIEGAWNRMGKGLNRSIESVLSLKGLAAAYGVEKVLGYGKATLETYDMVASESKKLNTSAETLQRLGAAADILGNTSLEALSKGLLKLRRQLIDEPTGDLAQGLEEIGFKAQAFLKMDADEQMLTLADAFDKASKDGRALPILTQAMGKGFAELIPLLSGGRSELKRFMDEAVVMSDSAVAAADDLNDRFDVMIGKVSFLSKGMALSLARGLGEMASDIGKKTGMWDMSISRTEIDHDGSEAAKVRQEKQAESQAKRDAEAKAAAVAALRTQKEQLAIRDRDLNARHEAIKLARAEVEIMELELRGQTGKFSEAETLKENSFISKRAHEHSAGGLDAEASIKLAAREWTVLIAQQRRAETEKARAQKSELESKRESLAMERKGVDLLEAEAKGQTRKVAKLKEAEYITKRMQELSSLSIGPKDAENMARRELKAREETEKFLETGRSHIGGVKKKRTMGDTFHGLDQHYRNQEKEYESEGPARPGYERGRPRPKYDAFGNGWGPPTSAQRTGRYMGGERAGTRSYGTTEVYSNAKKHTASMTADLGGKLDQTNRTLMDIKEGIV